MTEKELIGKIRELRQIQPRKDWVSLTKIQILGNVEVRPQPFYFPYFKPAFAGLISVLVLFGVLNFAQNSLPGDILYSLKKLTEKSQAVFVSKEELPKYNLEIANKRLDELTEIAQTNQVKKLASAISEFQVNMSEAAKSLAKVKGGVDVEKIVAQTKKLEENKQKIEEVLATKIETEKFDDALSQLVEREIKELESQTLTEEQKLLFEEAKADFSAGNYSQALEKILILSYQSQ